MINGELIVDNFAGGGGASTGIELATGYSVDIAINHDPEAVKMHKAKVYISGPITGHADYLEEFAHTEREVIALFDGHVEIINPAKIGERLPDSTTWEEYMKLDYILLDMADTIYMMPGWRESTGACIEYGYAYAKGKKILKAEEKGETNYERKTNII